MEHPIRFTRYPLAASERPQTIFDYYVTGRGIFPFDMLRYDYAWPADSESAAIIMDDCHHSLHGKLRSVHLRSYRHPTIERWSSFLWSVGPSPF